MKNIPLALIFTSLLFITLGLCFVNLLAVIVGTLLFYIGCFLLSYQNKNKNNLQKALQLLTFTLALFSGLCLVSYLFNINF